MAQNVTALEVYLQDLQRAGVTDFAADVPFNFLSDALAPTSKPAVVTEVVSQTVVEKKTPKTAQKASENIANKPVAPYADPKVLAQTKPKKNVPHVWSIGANAEAAQLQVLVFQKTISHEAFDAESLSLFSKMMQAIGQSMESIRYVMHSDQEDQQEALLKELNTNTPLLIVGQDSCTALTGKMLSEMRGNVDVSGFKNVGIVAHPSLLLKQPVLKRTAWKDLQNFIQTKGMQG